MLVAFEDCLAVMLCNGKYTGFVCCTDDVFEIFPGYKVEVFIFHGEQVAVDCCEGEGWVGVVDLF